MRRQTRRGAVLIIVLAVLIVLALLATTFATLQGTERQLAKNYLDLVRAKLAAEAGVDSALSDLRKMAESDLIGGAGTVPWRYYGNDLDETGDPALMNVPLEESQNPSYAVEDESPQNPLNNSPRPKNFLLQGQPRGVSGVLTGGYYGPNTEQYVLNVSDASGKLYINEGLNALKLSGGESTGTMNMKRILNILGTVTTPAVPQLGTRIMAQRPAQGYSSVLELTKVLDTAEYAAVSPFLTAHAWQDRRVVNPVPLTAAHAGDILAEFGVEYWRGSPSVYRFGRGVNWLNQAFAAPYAQLQVYSARIGPPAFAPTALDHAVYAMDELNPQWIERTSRAPVNVNIASREVLIALLTDVRGVFVSNRRRNNLETNKVGSYHYGSVRHTFSPERMTPPPASSDGDYTYPASYYDVYRVQEGDETGFLYETCRIASTSSMALDEVSASAIAIHIMACRQGVSTTAVNMDLLPIPVVDYSDKVKYPFAGPFRTWRQFNAFCDNLVTEGVIVDKRPIFYDHRPSPLQWAGYTYTYGNITGFTELVQSAYQQQIASQAIADALKANFNPNLHLNELNPDRNRWQRVDKTDLLVCSTEFTFTPTGYYDVESLGRVLRPLDPAYPDVLSGGSDSALVAEARVHAGIKLFEPVRETSQVQFMSGSINGSSAVATNNNRSLEVGPEPDNGNGPWENEWGGYIGFPTCGGVLPVGTYKASKSLQGTPSGGSEMGETLHSHLSWDFHAHHHKDGADRRLDLGRGLPVDADEQVFNYADPGESDGGLYDPVDDPSRYRLARSFYFDAKAGVYRPSPETGGGGSGVNFVTRAAPMDLRIDGGYLERHAGLAYWISQNSYVPNTRAKEGALSFWVKPGFFPELSGKPRMFMDMSRIATTNYANWGWSGTFQAANFMLVWNAGHEAAIPGPIGPGESNNIWGEYVVHSSYPPPAAIPTTQFRYSQTFGLLPFKPQALTFGVGYGWATGFSLHPTIRGWVSYYTQLHMTPPLNHIGHQGDPVGARTLMKGHEWMHLALSWKKAELDFDHATNAMRDPTCSRADFHGNSCPFQHWSDPVSWPAPTVTPEDYKLYVNGQIVPNSIQMRYSFKGYVDPSTPNGRRDTSERDHLIDWTYHDGGGRNQRYRNGDRNSLRFGSPSLVGRRMINNARTVDVMYDNFAPDSTLDEIYFWNRRSAEGLAQGQWLNGRYYFPRSAAEGIFRSQSITTTAIAGRSTAPAASGGTTTPPLPLPVRILGISWTWFGEAQETVAGTYVPYVTNYGPAGGKLYPTVGAALVGLTPPGQYVTEDGYSTLRDATGAVPQVAPGSSFQYELKFSLPGADPLNTILLTSPYVDDVTLYVAAGDTTFTYYYYVGIAL